MTFGVKAEARINYSSESNLNDEKLISNIDISLTGYQIDEDGDFHFYDNGRPLISEYNSKGIYFNSNGKMENSAYRHKDVNEALSEAFVNKQPVKIEGIEQLRCFYDYFTVNYSFDLCNNEMVLNRELDKNESYTVYLGREKVNRQTTYNTIKERFGNLSATTNSSNIEKQLKEKLLSLRYDAAVYKTDLGDSITLNKVACWQCGKIIQTLLKDVNIESELLVVEVDGSVSLRHVLVRFKENEKWIYIDPTIIYQGLITPSVVSYEYVLKHYTPVVNITIIKV